MRSYFDRSRDFPSEAGVGRGSYNHGDMLVTLNYAAG